MLQIEHYSLNEAWANFLARRLHSELKFVRGQHYSITYKRKDEVCNSHCFDCEAIGCFETSNPIAIPLSRQPVTLSGTSAAFSWRPFDVLWHPGPVPWPPGRQLTRCYFQWKSNLQLHFARFSAEITMISTVHDRIFIYINVGAAFCDCSIFATPIRQI